MNKYIPLFVLLITLLISSSQVFADGYIDKEVTSSNVDLILKYEVEFLPGIKDKQNQFGGAYLVNPNSTYKNIEIMGKDSLPSELNSTLQQLDEIEVANGNLLKVKFDHVWMVRN